MTKQVLRAGLSVAMLAAFNFSAQVSQGQGFCGTEVPTQQWEQQMQDLIRERNSSAQRSQPVAYTIPVIIHVIHGGQAVGVYPNLTQAQLVSQVQVLNEDFAGIGYNSGNYNSQAFSNYAQIASLQQNNLDAFGRVKIANTMVQFCLATKDTNGNVLPEPGIDRVNYSTKGWSNPAGATSYNSFKTLIDNVIKPGTIWDVRKYLNIWVTDENLNAVGLLGYATFPPFSTLTGIPNGAGTATTDGFWCYAKSFGSVGSAPSGTYTAGNNRGRTCTHEIGHYLGLRHIWGDGNCATDYCDDTPPASDKNFGGGSYPFKVGSCNNSNPNNSPDGEMYMNFMDYTDDPIKYMFTEDQATRIQTAMANSPFRKFLGTHNLCTVTQVAANAAFNTPLSICGSPAVITMSNQSSGVPAPGYTWNVTGNGVISPGPNSPMVSINFPAQGTYTISLSADNGTLSTVSKVVSVIVPTVAVTGADTLVCEGKQITLTGTGGNYVAWTLLGGAGSTISPTISFSAMGVVQYSCMSVWGPNCKTGTIVTVKAKDCTGLDNISLSDLQFNLNPNPVTSAAQVQLPGASGILRVTNVAGAILREETISADLDTYEINCAGLANGLYFVTWQGDKGAKTIRFIKE